MKSNEKTMKRNISQVLLAGIAGSHALYFSVCSGKLLQTRGRFILPLFVLSTASKGKDFRDLAFSQTCILSHSVIQKADVFNSPLEMRSECHFFFLFFLSFFIQKFLHNLNILYAESISIQSFILAFSFFA